MNGGWIALARIGFALLVGAAVVTQVTVLIDQGVFDPTRFFLFFTILSNLFAAAALLEGGRRQLSGQPPVPDMIRGAAVVYMAVTYIVFAVLLSDLQEELQTNVVWVDSVLHRVIPIVMLVDWLLDPPRTPIPFRRALVWVAWPLIWTTFTLVRGAVDGWYPYPFLDPANGGYGTVAVYAVVIFVGFVVVSWAIATVGTALRSRSGGVRPSTA